jgi:hypothetical protein
MNFYFFSFFNSLQLEYLKILRIIIEVIELMDGEVGQNDSQRTLDEDMAQEPIGL